MLLTTKNPQRTSLGTFSAIFTRLQSLAIIAIGTVSILGQPSSALSREISPFAISQQSLPQESLPQKIEAQTGPPIFNTSSPAAIALAKHLTQSNARFFGVWWCKYCHMQKELFGREAINEITYVECDIRGVNPQRDLCIASQVPAFPTWEINGNRYSGVQTLDQLADISGYAGDRQF